MLSSPPFWTRIVETGNNGSYWLSLNPLGTGKEGYPIYFTEPGSSPIIVARNLADFLNLLDGSPHELFHEKDNFEHILIEKPYSEVALERVQKIEKAIVSCLKAGTLNPPFRGIPQWYGIYPPEDLWRLLEAADGGIISTDAGDVTLLPFHKLNWSGPKEGTNDLLHFGELTEYSLMLHPKSGNVIAANRKVAANRRKKRMKGRILAPTLGDFIINATRPEFCELFEREPNYVKLQRR